MSLFAEPDPNQAEVWFHSSDEESWLCASNFSTREAAIEDALYEYAPNAMYWTGQREEIELRIGLWHILEQLSESATEQAGEAIEREGWPSDLSKEDEAELATKITALVLEKVGKPRSFKIVDVKKHIVPEGIGS